MNRNALNSLLELLVPALGRLPPTIRNIPQVVLPRTQFIDSLAVRRYLKPGHSLFVSTSLYRWLSLIHEGSTVPLFETSAGKNLVK